MWLTKPQLLQRLDELAKTRALDQERAELLHREADKALLDYIGDGEIIGAYQAIEKLYDRI